MSATEHATGLAIAAVRAAADKKIEHLVVIDISERLGFTDAFLLASGMSDRHAHAIADMVGKAMHRAGARHHTREGFTDTHWVLVDYDDVVVHILQNEDRGFHSLGHLRKNCSAIGLPTDLAHESSQDGDSLGSWETTTS